MGDKCCPGKVYVMLMITPYPHVKPIVGIFGHPEHLLKLISNCVTTSLELIYMIQALPNEWIASHSK